MEILKEAVTFSYLKSIQPAYFSDMVKGVCDLSLGVIALNAEMHVDLEQLLLDRGSRQEDLVGFNIYWDKTVELDSNINPPVNKRLGYPRAGRLITDPATVLQVEDIIKRLVDFDV